MPCRKKKVQIELEKPFSRPVIESLDIPPSLSIRTPLCVDSSEPNAAQLGNPSSTTSYQELFCTSETCNADFTKSHPEVYPIVPNEIQDENGRCSRCCHAVNVSNNVPTAACDSSNCGPYPKCFKVVCPKLKAVPNTAECSGMSCLPPSCCSCNPKYVTPPFNCHAKPFATPDHMKIALDRQSEDASTDKNTSRDKIIGKNARFDYEDSDNNDNALTGKSAYNNNANFIEKDTPIDNHSSNEKYAFRGKYTPDEGRVPTDKYMSTSEHTRYNPTGKHIPTEQLPASSVKSPLLNNPFRIYPSEPPTKNGPTDQTADKYLPTDVSLSSDIPVPNDPRTHRPKYQSTHTSGKAPIDRTAAPFDTGPPFRSHTLETTLPDRDINNPPTRNYPADIESADTPLSSQHRSYLDQQVGNAPVERNADKSSGKYVFNDSHNTTNEDTSLLPSHPNNNTYLEQQVHAHGDKRTNKRTGKYVPYDNHSAINEYNLTDTRNKPEISGKSTPVSTNPNKHPSEQQSKLITTDTPTENTSIGASRDKYAPTAPNDSNSSIQTSSNLNRTNLKNQLNDYPSNNLAGNEASCCSSCTLCYKKNEGNHVSVDSKAHSGLPGATTDIEASDNISLRANKAYKPDKHKELQSHDDIIKKNYNGNKAPLQLREERYHNSSPGNIKRGINEDDKHGRKPPLQPRSKAEETTYRSTYGNMTRLSITDEQDNSQKSRLQGFSDRTPDRNSPSQMQKRSGNVFEPKDRQDTPFPYLSHKKSNNKRYPGYAVNSKVPNDNEGSKDTTYNSSYGVRMRVNNGTDDLQLGTQNISTSKKQDKQIYAPKSSFFEKEKDLTQSGSHSFRNSPENPNIRTSANIDDEILKNHKDDQQKEELCPCLETGLQKKCSCHFPPAFQHFGCTGNIIGNCTCATGD